MGQIVHAFHQHEAQEQYFLNSAGIRHCFIILTGTSNPSASNLLETLKKIFHTDVFIGIHLQRVNSSAEIILGSFLWVFFPLLVICQDLWSFHSICTTSRLPGLLQRYPITAAV